MKSQRTWVVYRTTSMSFQATCREFSRGPQFWRGSGWCIRLTGTGNLTRTMRSLIQRTLINVESSSTISQNKLGSSTTSKNRNQNLPHTCKPNRKLDRLDMASNIIMDLLLGKIISILENEASLIGGVHTELDELKCELRSIKSFLEDVDRKGAVTGVERAWVADVTDICHPIEDIIAEFMYRLNPPQRGGRLTRYLYQAFYFPKRCWTKHTLAQKIHDINKRIKAIPERRERYVVDVPIGAAAQDDQRRARDRSESFRFASDDHLLGIEEDARLLEKWLIDGDRERSVISVSGMGGSGKSTLVAKVFKGQTVKRHFECYAWITVSQTYVIEDVFRSMITEFYGSGKEKVPVDLSTMKYADLLEMLVYYLQKKTYVVVLDDVWRNNLWNDVKVSLPDKGRGSRVMLTTRNEKIASSSFGVKSHVHQVQPLKSGDACMGPISQESILELPK
ncbi:hypothetical protein RJ640_000927 [Escallonia rubra]|uniref:Uncharacterized protein n=1 Tax=Escallonia rubra TaxID=112253 RepID=A0AA88UCH9_9ASTE|nr:hypothetical protein RJ640_000927 [Escallonia rubra]